MLKIGKRRIGTYHLKELERRVGGNYLKVLKRDKNKCVLCNWTTFIMVHHLDNDLKNNKMSNLLTVCKRCHAELHGQMIRFTKPSMELIMELRQQGKTYQGIGNHLGISRQRVHQLIRGYWSHNGARVKGIEERLIL